jgi:hypothetical protein
MIHDCRQTRVNVIRLGAGLDHSELYTVLGTANQAQKAFRFVVDLSAWPVDLKYRLPNGGYELDTALEVLLKTKKYRKLERPIVAISKLPLGDKEFGSEPGYFFFSSTAEADPYVTTVSTHPLTVLPNRTLHEYVLLMLSTNIFSIYGDIYYHDETRGCLLDYCDDLRDAEQAFRNGRLCDVCERDLQKKVENGYINLDTIAAGTKLLNRAVGRSYCFVAMPFGPMFDPVYDTVRGVLNELGWDVKRADEIIYPRLVTDRIVREIMSSDIMIADLSGSNPNVFYEVGLGVALGNDLVLITQDKEIPFDLRTHHTVFYGPGGGDLTRLRAGIRKSIGPAPTKSPAQLAK